MMYYYFLSHPNIATTAVVEAPSTEKARTSFLDYLERNGQVPRRQRREWRKNMATKRITDPNSVAADLRLDYDLSEVPRLALGPVLGTTSTFPQEVSPYIPENLEASPYSPSQGPPSTPTYGTTPETEQMSPLRKLALGIQ